MAAQPVGGPGPFSRRSDLGPAQAIRELPDAAYGEAKTFREQQQAAPLASAPRGGGGGGGDPLAALSGGPQFPLVGFDAPSQYPDEPVTAGIDVGPGAPSPGPRGRVGSLSEVLSRLVARDSTGEMERLLSIAEANGW